MISKILKWLIIVLATLNFSYMIFDGSRAMIKGDYLRPATGEYAGELGPWSNLVKAIGIDPESTNMKLTFIVWGMTGILITVAYALNRSWGWRGMLLINLISLWYLWMGTIFSIIQIFLLSFIGYKNSKNTYRK